MTPVPLCPCVAPPQAINPKLAGYDPTKFVVSPITGELVPIDEMAEHMRISLIDPRCVCVGVWRGTGG